jgi:hypothetical protein
MNGDPKITLKLKLDHDASAIAERAERRLSSNRLVRIKAEGAALGTAGTTYSKKTILLDLVGSYMTPEPYSDDDGITSLEFEMATHYNATAALGGRIVVVNELSALP